MAYSTQAKQRIKRNKKIEKTPAKRQSFKRFWQTFTLYRDWTRRERRALALNIWRRRKGVVS